MSWSAAHSGNRREEHDRTFFLNDVNNAIFSHVESRLLAARVPPPRHRGRGRFKFFSCDPGLLLRFSVTAFFGFITAKSSKIMSYIQDIGAMRRYQGLIEKEKIGQSSHPATTLMRQRYERQMDPGQTLRPAPHGSRI